MVRADVPCYVGRQWMLFGVITNSWLVGAAVSVVHDSYVGFGCLFMAFLAACATYLIYRFENDMKALQQEIRRR